MRIACSKGFQGVKQTGKNAAATQQDVVEEGSRQRTGSATTCRAWPPWLGSMHVAELEAWPLMSFNVI